MKTINTIIEKFKVYIIELAKKILAKDLEIKHQEILCRKGTRRYRFTVFYTPHGAIRYNLGRHYEHEDHYGKIGADSVISVFGQEFVKSKKTTS